MPITLIAEDGTGRADANTLQLPAGVSAILDGHPFATAWADAEDRWDALVIEASAWFARLSWVGWRLNATQAQAFPQWGLETRDGYAVASTSVPSDALLAHARLCLYLAQQTESPYEATGLAPGSTLKVGPLTLTPAAPGALPLDVRSTVRHWLRSNSTLVRV